MKRGAPLLVVAGLVVTGLVVTGCTAPADCPASAGWRDTIVTVHHRSRLVGRRLEAGPIARCRDKDAERAWRAARKAHAAMGILAPASVAIHVDVIVEDAAPIDRLESHARGVLVEGGPYGTAAWIHELAHRRIDRIAGQDGPGERLMAAAEEGLADHAAHLFGYAVERPRRRGPPSPSASWSALARPELRFDPHPLGERFAMVLAETSTTTSTTLGLMIALGRVDTATSVSSALERWRSPINPVLDDTLRTWVPPALWSAGR